MKFRIAKRITNGSVKTNSAIFIQAPFQEQIINVQKLVQDPAYTKYNGKMTRFNLKIPDVWV
jgi:hypothetical protein